jgi:hypothetical protein
MYNSTITQELFETDPELRNLLQALGRRYSLERAQSLVAEVIQRSSTSALTEEYGASRPDGVAMLRYELQRLLDK